MDVSDSMDGSWSSNPMIFPAAQYKVNYVNFYVDGRPIMARPYEPDFKNANSQRSYMGLLEAARVLNTGKEIAMDNNLFQICYGIFGLDLSADGSCLTRTEHGILSVEVRFAEKTPKVLTGLLFAAFPSMLTLGVDRNVSAYPI